MRSTKMGCGTAGKPLQPGGLRLSAELDVAQSPSLGLQLVCVLVDQLNGTMEVSGDEGTAFTITFG
jgi:two-component sensor histidine kinase